MWNYSVVFSLQHKVTTTGNNNPYLCVFGKYTLAHFLHNRDITGQMRCLGSCHHRIPVTRESQDYITFPRKKNIKWRRKRSSERVRIWLSSTNISLLWNLKRLLHQTKKAFPLRKIPDTHCTWNILVSLMSSDEPQTLVMFLLWTSRMTSSLLILFHVKSQLTTVYSKSMLPSCMGYIRWSWEDLGLLWILTTYF